MHKIDTNLYGELIVQPCEGEIPSTEALGWNTHINDCHNGTEDRHQNSSMPRQEFDFKIPLNYTKRQESLNALYGGIRDRWAVPVWTESQDIGVVTGGSTTLTCETSLYDFRDDSLAIIYESEDDYEIVEIETVGSGVLNLYAPGPQSRLSARLMPVRVCLIDSNVKNSVSGFNNMESIKFRVVDNARITDTSNPFQLDDTDAYFDDNLKKNKYSTRATVKRVVETDFKIGAFEQRTEWVDTRQTGTLMAIAQGPNEIRNFRMFLQRRAGRFNPFYYPSFESDFEIVSTGVITSTILVRSNSIIDFVTARTKLMFKTESSNTTRTVVTFIQQSPTQVAMVFDSDLNLDAADIKYISYLGFYRLNTDKVKLKWIGNGTIETSIPIIEIKPVSALPPVVE